MIKKIMAYAKESRIHFVVSLILMGISVLSWVAAFIGAYYLIEGFIEQRMDMMLFIKCSIAIAAALVFKAVFKSVGLKHSHIFAYNALGEIRKDFAAKLINNPLGTTLSQPAGSFRQKMVDGIEQIEIILAHAFPEGIPYIMSAVVVVVMIFIADYRLGLLALVPLAIGMFLLARMFKTTPEKAEKYYESSKTMSANIVEYIRGIEVIKIFNHNEESYKKLTDSVLKYRDFTLGWYRESWTTMSVVNSISPTVALFVLPAGVLFMMNGSLSLTGLIFISLLCFSAAEPLTKVQTFSSVVFQINKKLEDLEKDFQAIDLCTGSEKISDDNLDIEYRGVNFAYDEVQVIKNADFTIKQGEKVSFVGESGSGKSTLVKLLMHYYDISGGEICIGGRPLIDIDMESLMDKISYVSQDNFLFDISIRDNILIGRPGASKEDVFAAAKAANIHDFIMGLEQGYDTRVGDSGDKLSGGEKQRICIARAIIKDAPIVILDEATSFTDPENEYYINSAIDSLLENKTVIMIAHKLARAAKSDKIILVDEGEIKAVGSHEELLNNEVYKNLWDRFVDSTQFEFTVEGGSNV